MVKKLLKSGLLAMRFGCRNRKNFSDYVILLAYLNSRFYESKPVHDFIRRVCNFIFRGQRLSFFHIATPSTMTTTEEGQ